MGAFFFFSIVKYFRRKLAEGISSLAKKISYTVNFDYNDYSASGNDFQTYHY